MWATLSIIICFALLIIGSLGVVLPVLPGIPLAWLGLFIYALATGFENISIVTIVIFFILMVISMLLDFIAPLLGAQKYRASKLGILGTFIGSLVGIFVLGFWGIILGPLVGAICGELLARANPKQALESSVGTMVGCIFGSLFKLVIILIMAGFCIASLF